jgi:hypothetical protein
MTDYRANHGCAKIKRSGKDYLVAVAGDYGPNLTQTNTIEFYDLTLMPNSWEFIPRVILPQSMSVRGMKITVFEEGICEAIILGSDGNCLICTGNYTWTSGNVPYFQWGNAFHPVIDANVVGGDTVW